MRITRDESPAPAAVVVECPGLRLRNPLNGSHRHWSGPASERKSQRAAVGWALVRAYGSGPPPVLPCVVTITRVGPRALDDDNLAASCKSVRDEVATWLRVDDRSPSVTWAYRQERGPYAVRVEVTRRSP